MPRFRSAWRSSTQARWSTSSLCSNAGVITIYGVLALTFMMTMYALEQRGRVYVVAFALGCALSSVYGFLSGAWPFGVVEAIWALIALVRYQAALNGA
jgi:hypothetical protein